MESLYKKDKYKRYATIGAAGLFLAMLGWVVLGLGDSKEEEDVTPVADVEVIEKEKTLDESIRAKFSEELVALREQNKALENRLNSLDRESADKLNKLEADTRDRLDRLGLDTQDKLDKLGQDTKKQADKDRASSDKRMQEILDQLKLADPDNLTTQANLIPPPPEDVAELESKNRNVRDGAGSGASSSGGRDRDKEYSPYATNSQGSPVVTVMTGLISVGSASLQSEAEKKKEKAKLDKKDLIIPTGSFVRAQLVSGVIAPTGGQGANEPVPALLRVTGLTQLPNFNKADIKNCFILAETKGNLSTETVNFRLKTLACKRGDGSTLEREVEGYVTGENGMEGMTGRVVSKQGALIARAFIAEFASGIGEAFESTGTTTSITASGIINTSNANNILQAGLGAGFAEAFSRVGDFYMDLAEQMVPVIEINAGRNVDVVFIKSVDLDVSEEEQKKYDEKLKALEEEENGKKKKGK